MFVSELYVEGFRCFGPEAPLSLALRRGLNILVGPNDAGKTAVIDAAKHVLWTRGDDFVRLEPSDFHVRPNGERVTDLLIRCSFGGLSEDEESRFLEWCDNEGGELRLHVCLAATLRILAGGGHAVNSRYRAGRNADGLAVEGELREYLKATYLRPLRDAERELSFGRRSRLSRILGALPTMSRQSQRAKPGDGPTLVDTMQSADSAIENNQGIREVQRTVNETYLDDLSFSDDLLSATLGIGAKGSFDQLLERLELYLNPPVGQKERVRRGLGYNNLLFMAAELLLLQSHSEQLPFLLIEEPEAHLHPQHQTLFMQLLDDKASPPAKEAPQQQVQVLLSTHSPQLAASADLTSMVLLMGHLAFPLGKGQTKLEEDDYGFLRRFLDATKANLFFARGVIVVEGDAENILLPAIAAKIGRPLGKHGVSIVNVGHRGLFRYSRILQRADGTSMPVRVALVPDRDIPPDAAKWLLGEDRRTESEWGAEKKKAHLDKLRSNEGGSVACYPSEQWTLEHDIALHRECAVLVHQAVAMANATASGRQKAAEEARTEVEHWWKTGEKTDEMIAVEIYRPLHKGLVSKPEVAEHLAKLIGDLEVDAATFRAWLPEYIVKAIDFATSAKVNPETPPLADPQAP